MTLSSTSRPSIRGKVLARLPATVQATGGLSFTKENGVWTVEPDWTALALEEAVATPADRQLWTFNPTTGVYTRLSVQFLIDELPAGPDGDDGSLIFVQNDAPATSEPEGSLWIDANSTDLDLYQLVSEVWTDTGANVKGVTGATGATGAAYGGTSVTSNTIGSSGTKTFATQTTLAYQPGTRVRAADASAPTVNWMEGVVTSYAAGSLAFTADRSLGSGTLTNWTLSVAGQPGVDGLGTGDVVGPASATADSLARFDGPTGKLLKDGAVIGTDVGRPPTRQVFTSSGTWNKPAGLTKVIVRALGGGGGGGGSGATVGGEASVGAGGNGGGYTEKIIVAASLGATETVTIGAAGAAGAASGAGGAGGTTSFGAHCSATGGGGGAIGPGGAAPRVSANSTSPGLGSGGDFNAAGGVGGGGVAPSASVGISGAGGNSLLGGGGRPVVLANAGVAATGYGAGGSGGASAASDATGRVGGAGTAGIIVVEEFYN